MPRRKSSDALPGFQLDFRPVFRDPPAFSRYAGRLPLRSYQQEVMRAVVESVMKQRGLSLVVMFPRQSGKNELQAHIEALLLRLLSVEGAEIVKISPTWRPQTVNAMRRLERVLVKNQLTGPLWRKEKGYIYRIGQARIVFLSGSPQANIVGATASTLLELDEAQDIAIDKYDRDIAPMAASTNATRVFFGTAWTGQTLLARELRAAQEAEQRDGVRRVFRIGADQVAAEVPAYGRYVAEQTARMGRQHPMIKTQYYSEELEGESGMFPAERLALMQVLHPAQALPTPGRVYALLVDVGGEDALALPAQVSRAWSPLLPGMEALANPRRDSTALTVVNVDLSTCSDPLLGKPTYRTVWRQVWTGAPHSALYAQLRGLVETWQPRRLVVDATGVGAGLASFLSAAFGERVMPFTFNTASKSRLGWRFLEIADSGRYKEYASAPGSPHLEELRDLFFAQCSACGMEVRAGPDNRLGWGVPENAARAARHGSGLLHDDLLMSAALCAVLDELTWHSSGATLLVPARDPLAELDKGF